MAVVVHLLHTTQNMVIHVVVLTVKNIPILNFPDYSYSLEIYLRVQFSIYFNNRYE